MKVIQLKGLDTDLYPLIGPLVMNPKVLRLITIIHSRLRQIINGILQ